MRTRPRGPPPAKRFKNAARLSRRDFRLGDDPLLTAGGLDPILESDEIAGQQARDHEMRRSGYRFVNRSNQPDGLIDLVSMMGRGTLLWNDLIVRGRSRRPVRIARRRRATPGRIGFQCPFGGAARGADDLVRVPRPGLANGRCPVGERRLAGRSQLDPYRPADRRPSLFVAGGGGSARSGIDHHTDAVADHGAHGLARQARGVGGGTDHPNGPSIRM